MSGVVLSAIWVSLRCCCATLIARRGSGLPCRTRVRRNAAYNCMHCTESGRRCSGQARGTLQSAGVVARRSPPAQGHASKGELEPVILGLDARISPARARDVAGNPRVKPDDDASPEDDALRKDDPRPSQTKAPARPARSPTSVSRRSPRPSVPETRRSDGHPSSPPPVRGRRRAAPVPSPPA